MSRSRSDSHTDDRTDERGLVPLRKLSSSKSKLSTQSKEGPQLPMHEPRDNEILRTTRFHISEASVSDNREVFPRQHPWTQM